MYIIFGINNNQIFKSQNFRVLNPVGEKLFFSWDVKFKATLTTNLQDSHTGAGTFY